MIYGLKQITFVPWFKINGIKNFNFKTPNKVKITKKCAKEINHFSHLRAVVERERDESSWQR